MANRSPAYCAATASRFNGKPMPRLPEETIEQIAAANDIVEVIASYFPLKRMGPAFKALCPFHQDQSPSFTVNPQRQIFKCLGCGAAGRRDGFPLRDGLRAR